MLKTSVHLFNRLFPNLAWGISRWWFELVSRYDSGDQMLFMNYGYADADAARLPLQAEDEKHRYFIQLYHRVAGWIDLRGKTILEVGSGRGGGCAYLLRYLRPKSVTGLELAASAVAFSRQRYRLAGLTFLRGDAEALPWADNSFDAIVNVESSLCYQYVERFLGEVTRVLKPDGHFLYADLRHTREIDAWHAQLGNTGLELLEREEITPNVIRALDADNARKEKLIRRHAPRMLRPAFREFAALKGTRFFYDAFQNGQKQYWRFGFRKPAA